MIVGLGRKPAFTSATALSLLITVTAKIARIALRGL
jgi:hypothetical protein